MFGFLSRDPLYSLLRSFGYNVVRLPRSTIKPLQLFTKKNNQLYPLGQMSGVFVSRGDVSLPNILENQPVADLSGKKSGDLSLGLGLSILGGILSSFGGSAAGLDAKYGQAKSVSFQYEEVLEDSVEMTQLDRFLDDADIDPHSKSVGALLESDQVYVTTSTIKSRKFTIVPKAKGGAELGINVPEIQKIVGGNVKVSRSNKDSSVITFGGDTPLVFGVQVWQLFYDNGKYTRSKPAPPKMMLKPSGTGRAKLLTDGPFISIGE